MRLCIPFVGSMSGAREPKTLFMYLSPKGSPYPIQGRERKPSVNITPLAGKIHVQVGLAPTPPGLDLRRAPRIVRELPPSLTAYRVAVWFRAAPLAAPTLVRSTVGAKRKTPAILGRSVTSGGGRLRRFERENFPRRENALHHQRPNLKALGFYSLSNRRLPHRQSNVTMNSTAMSMAVSPGCLGLPPAPLAGVFFEPVTECLSISQ
jgi:hypothetical protein